MKNKKIIITICFFCMIFICSNLWASRSSRHIACLSNQRVIQDAVELYNMDYDNMMHNLDMKILVEGEYLKSEPSKPESSCEYKSMGDLADSGIIFCKYHGDVERLVYCDFFKNDKYEQYEKLPQDATDEYYRLNRERISEERESYSKKVEHREKMQFYFFMLCIPIGIIMFIISIIPGRKKSN